MKEGDARSRSNSPARHEESTAGSVGSGLRRPRFYKGDWLMRARRRARAVSTATTPSRRCIPLATHYADGEPLDGSKHNYTLTFPPGPIAAGERLLVGDDVRRQDPAADREPDQPLPDQLADAAGHEEERRRLADALHPEGLAGQGQGIQLAARAGRPDLPRHAALLAEDRAALDPAAGEGTWKPPVIKKVS